MTSYDPQTNCIVTSKRGLLQTNLRAITDLRAITKFAGDFKIINLKIYGKKRVISPSM